MGRGAQTPWLDSAPWPQGFHQSLAAGASRAYSRIEQLKRVESAEGDNEAPLLSWVSSKKVELTVWRFGYAPISALNLRRPLPIRVALSHPAQCRYLAAAPH